MSLKPLKLDIAEQIQHLSVVIRQLCEDHNISKDIVLEDFKYMLMRENENHCDF